MDDPAGEVARPNLYTHAAGKAEVSAYGCCGDGVVVRAVSVDIYERSWDGIRPISAFDEAWIM